MEAFLQVADVRLQFVQWPHVLEQFLGFLRLPAEDCAQEVKETMRGTYAE